MKVAIGADHGGYALKETIKAHLREKGIDVQDLGTHSTASVDYPKFGFAVGSAVISGQADFGIVICGTGLGISMSANKIPGIRAAVCTETFSARLAREHNNANVLALGGRVTGVGLALDIVDVFLQTPFSGEVRHARRIDMIGAWERGETNALARASLPQVKAGVAPDPENLARDWQKILEEFWAQAKLRPGQILVLGCSTSEVVGQRIGRGSSLQVAETLLPPLLDRVRETGVFLAVQGCEHINRALVVEQACLDKYGLEEVTVLPALHAGGAMAVKAWESFARPVMVEKIQGHAGLDVGDTFIGMHLRPVVVPIRIAVAALGAAHITAARTRPRLIGGVRAVYPQ